MDFLSKPLFQRLSEFFQQILLLNDYQNLYTNFKKLDFSVLTGVEKYKIVSPSHHNFFVRHINISSGANHTFGASLTYFLPPFGCRQLPARTLHFNQPLLRTVHYFCYFICGSITPTTSPDISLFSATSIDVTQLPTLHLWFQKRGGASNITVYCSNKK